MRYLDSFLRSWRFNHFSHGPKSPRLPREGSQFRPVEALVGAAGTVQRRRRALDTATPPTPGTGVAEALGGVVEGPALSQGSGDGV